MAAAHRRDRSTIARCEASSRRNGRQLDLRPGHRTPHRGRLASRPADEGRDTRSGTLCLTRDRRGRWRAGYVRAIRPRTSALTRFMKCRSPSCQIDGRVYAIDIVRLLSRSRSARPTRASPAYRRSRQIHRPALPGANIDVALFHGVLPYRGPPGYLKTLTLSVAERPACRCGPPGRGRDRMPVNRPPGHA